jgi:hypothetical protein
MIHLNKQLNFHSQMLLVLTRIRMTPCLQLQIIKSLELLPSEIAMLFPIPVSPTIFRLLDTLWSPGHRYNAHMSTCATHCCAINFENTNYLRRKGHCCVQKWTFLPVLLCRVNTSRQNTIEPVAYTKFQHRCLSCHELFAVVLNLDKCLIKVDSFIINPNFAISTTFKDEQIHERTFVFV